MDAVRKGEWACSLIPSMPSDAAAKADRATRLARQKAMKASVVFGPTPNVAVGGK